MNSINPNSVWMKTAEHSSTIQDQAYLTDELQEIVDLLGNLNGRPPAQIKLGLATIVSRLPSLFRREKLITNTHSSEELELYLSIQTNIEHLALLIHDLVEELDEPLIHINHFKKRVSNHILELNAQIIEPKPAPIYNLWNF